MAATPMAMPTSVRIVRPLRRKRFLRIIGRSYLVVVGKPVDSRSVINSGSISAAMAIPPAAYTPTKAHPIIQSRRPAAPNRTAAWTNALVPPSANRLTVLRIVLPPARRSPVPQVF
jgi:hypothetical protein